MRVLQRLRGCTLCLNPAEPNCLESRNRFQTAYGNTTGTARSGPPVFPSCTCRKTITPPSLPSGLEDLVWTGVSSSENKGAGMRRKSLKRCGATTRPSIYLRPWHSESGVTASQPEREGGSLCHNKEQRTEAEWGKGSRSLCARVRAVTSPFSPSGLNFNEFGKLCRCDFSLSSAKWSSDQQKKKKSPTNSSV